MRRGGSQFRHIYQTIFFVTLNFTHILVESGGRLFEHFVSSHIISRNRRCEFNRLLESRDEGDVYLPSQVQLAYFKRFGAQFRKWLLSMTKHELSRMKFELTLFYNLRGTSRSAINLLSKMDESFMKLRLFDAMKANELAQVKMMTQ